MSAPSKRAPTQQRTDESEDSTSTSLTDTTSLCETDASGRKCSVRRRRGSLSYKLRMRIYHRWALRVLTNQGDLPLTDESSSSSDETYQPSDDSSDDSVTSSSSEDTERHSDYSSGSYLDTSDSPSSFSWGTASGSHSDSSSDSTGEHLSLSESDSDSDV